MEWDWGLDKKGEQVLLSADYIREQQLLVPERGGANGYCVWEKKTAAAVVVVVVVDLRFFPNNKNTHTHPSDRERKKKTLPPLVNIFFCADMTQFNAPWWEHSSRSKGAISMGIIQLQHQILSPSQKKGRRRRRRRRRKKDVPSVM